MKYVKLYIPAKVMLAGEYAVLRGGHCLAATLDYGLTIEISIDQNATQWTVSSNLWSEPKIVTTGSTTPNPDILCRAVEYNANLYRLPGGRVSVLSDIQISHGVGSSSALRLGICAGFACLNGEEFEPSALGPSKLISQKHLQEAWKLQHESQGLASGYDLVTQNLGGLVEFAFEFEGNKWKPHWFKHDLGAINDIAHVFVGGEGAPTTQTMGSTTSWLDLSSRFDRLLEASESLVDVFNLSLQWPTEGSLRRLFQQVGVVRQMFQGSPNFPTHLASVLSQVPGLDQTWSWKTTGAGGEDAILLIGTNRQIAPAIQALSTLGWTFCNARFSTNGAQTLSVSNLKTTEPNKTRSNKREFLK